MSKLPSCSIIVSNYNMCHLLKDCFNSLKNLNYPKNRYEVILVDDNSSDDSVKFTKKKFSWIKILVLDKNYGLAGANNKALKVAKGDYIIFLNNDTIVRKNWLIELVKAASSDKKIGICGSRCIDARYKGKSLGEGYISIFGFARNLGKSNRLKEVSWASGTSLLVKRKVLDKLEYCFDESYSAYFEDVDLCWRTWLLGYKVMYVPTSILDHLGGLTHSKVMDILLHHHRNKILTFKKNLRAPLKQITLIPIFLSSLTSIIYFILNKKWKHGILPLKYFFYDVKENPILKKVPLKKQLQIFYK